MKKLMRSMLFCPADNLKMLMTAHLKNPDCVIFDLEDAIVYQEKDNARNMLCHALETVSYGECMIFVRINSLNTIFGHNDVKELVRSGIKYIRLPMCEGKENIFELTDMISHYEKQYNVEKNSIKIQAAIETPKGVINAMEIASCSDRVISISFGAEDFTNSLGVQRTKKGQELMFARNYIVLCASSCGIDSIDTVFSDLADMDGFINETTIARNIGFSGKSCIHPKQIEAVHKIYSPSSEEITQSVRLLSEFEKSKKNGIGVITVDGKMIDKPIVERAIKTLNLAKRAGLEICGGEHEYYK